MERFRRILKTLLFPHLAVVLASVPISAALLAYVFLFAGENSLVAYPSYALSAYALAIVCARSVRLKALLLEALHRNRHIHRYLTDVSFRTHVSLYLSLGVNLLFVAVKLFYSVYYRSVWFFTLGVYYIMLAVMRFLLLRHVNASGIGKELIPELRHYRLCGVILLLMNIALTGMVILVVTKNEGYQYTGYLIYVVAMYAFYSIISAAADVVKYRKYSSPVMSASKAIKLATALVSMLALETAMLAQFGEQDQALFRRVMTAVTGGCVCLLVLLIAVYMIIRSTRLLRQLKNTRAEARQREELR